MVVFSPEWCAERTSQWSALGAPPLPGEGPFRVVFSFTDGGDPHALTLTMAEVVSIEVGDHLMADCVIELSRGDAEAMIAGTSTSAAALRDGKLKVRGNINSLVAMSDWFRKAKPLES